MNREELVEILSPLLWEVVSLRVEQLDQLPIMLKDIGYLDDKDSMISEVTHCEIFVSDEFNVEGFVVKNNNILVTYEMPFVLSAWSERTQLLRITGTALGVCSVPDIEHYDWSNKDFGEMRKGELLEYQSLVDILECKCDYVECDDVSFL